MTKVRWAILGTSDVAAKFAIGLRSAPGAVAAVVVSRSPERGAAFAKRYGLAAAVTDADEAAAMDIDVAYIASPPTEHRRHAEAFIRGGKGVLIEKPFALSLADTDAIIAAARGAGVFCMEGFWTCFLPALAKARDLISSGAIGEPRSLFASFANMNIVEPESSFFRLDLGGGALAHRGVYPVVLAVELLGPAKVLSAVVRRGVTGVDEEIHVTLRHDSGAISSVYAGARTTAANNLEVLGTAGSLRLDGPIYRPFGVDVRPMSPQGRGARMTGRLADLKESPLAQNLRVRLRGLAGIGKKHRYLLTPYLGNGYAHEAIAVMDCLRSGLKEHPMLNLNKIHEMAALLDSIRRVSELEQ